MKRILYIGALSGICLAALLYWVIISKSSNNGDNSEKYAVDFVDQGGQHIQIKHYPERMLLLPYEGGVGASLQYAMDRSLKKLVAVDKNNYNLLSGTIYAKVIKDFNSGNVKRLNIRMKGGMNAEEIMKISPDIIVQWLHKKKWMDQMRNLGVQIVGLSCCSNKDRLGYINVFGELNGQRERAKQIISLNQKSIKTLKKISDNKQFATFLVLYNKGSHKGFKVSIKKFAVSDYGIGGLNNLAANSTNLKSRLINVEQIIKWDPELIILPGRIRTGGIEKYVNAVRKDPRLQFLQAVKSKHIFLAPQFESVPYAPEAFLVSEWLYIIAHSDMETAKKFRARIADVYYKIYGFKPSQDDIDDILRMDINGYAPRYRKLFGA